MNTLAYQISETEVDDGAAVSALCDSIAETLPEAGRQLATWIEGLAEQLANTKAELRDATTHRVEDIDQQVENDSWDDGVLEGGRPEVVKYHKSEGAAQQAGQRLMDADPQIKAFWPELVPYNGWVVVLQPGLADLSKYEPTCEVDRGGARKTFPDGAVKPEPLPPTGRQPKVSESGEVSAPSPKGSTGKVWEIADAAVAAGGWNRAGIMAACTAAGINPATAGTQYSKWKKARGL